MQSYNKLIAEVINETADLLINGQMPAKVKVGLTLIGSEHGVAEVLRGAENSQRQFPDIKVIVFWPS